MDADEQYEHDLAFAKQVTKYVPPIEWEVTIWSKDTTQHHTTGVLDPSEILRLVRVIADAIAKVPTPPLVLGGQTLTCGIEGHPQNHFHACGGRSPLHQALLDQVPEGYTIQWDLTPILPVIEERDPDCVAKWPGCQDGLYDPRCCRFPKECSPSAPKVMKVEPSMPFAEREFVCDHCGYITRGDGHLDPETGRYRCKARTP